MHEVVSTSVCDIWEGEDAWLFDAMWHISVRIRESAPLPAVAAASCSTGKFLHIFNSAPLPRKHAGALFCVSLHVNGGCMAVAQGDGG